MTEPPEERSTALPILIAAGIVGLLFAVIVLANVIRRDDVHAESGVGRAVVGQNDALQRGDYPAFRGFTCAAQAGSEAQVLAEQKQSADAKGARYVDDVTGIHADGDRATATVTYHFAENPDAKITAEMTFTREDGDWKVCSPGPR